MPRYLHTLMLATALSISALASANTLKLSNNAFDLFIDSPFADVDYTLQGNRLSMSLTGGPVTGNYWMGNTIQVVAHDGYAVNRFLAASIDHTTTTYGNGGTQLVTMADLNGYFIYYAGGIPALVDPLTYSETQQLREGNIYPGLEYFSNGVLTVSVSNLFNTSPTGQYSFSNFNVDLSVRQVAMPVPEADAYLMMLGGLALLGCVARLRRGAAAQ